ncbi:MAG: MFS transporter [Anaerolineae bacterium]
MSGASLTPGDEPRSRSSLLQVLWEPNFRLLWVGEGVSTLGTQFYLIALPWLVLKLTGSTFTLGSVLGLAGVPRALLLLVGGVLTDQFSPRMLMLASNTARLVLVALLAVLVIARSVEIWLLYALAFLFGLADAFFYPALFAIMPQILDKRSLQSGNAIVQGISQLSIAAGPVLAGLLIAMVGGTSVDTQSLARGAALPQKAYELRMEGIALAFAINALTFMVSVFTLRAIRPRYAEARKTELHSISSVMSSIKEGMLYVWRDGALRTIFAIAAALSLLGEGPVLVGVPVLADTRLPEGPAAFGIVMSCFGLGSVLGIVLAGIRSGSRSAGQRLYVLLPSACGLMGLGMLTFGIATSTFPISLSALAMGGGLGYTIVVLTTWLQQRTPAHLMGRMMSLMVLAVVGLIPVSQLLVGAMLELSTQFPFLVAGVLILAVAVWAATTSNLRSTGSIQAL